MVICLGEINPHAQLNLKSGQSQGCLGVISGSPKKEKFSGKHLLVLSNGVVINNANVIHITQMYE
jgi:hypothetical protein